MKNVFKSRIFISIIFALIGILAISGLYFFAYKKITLQNESIKIENYFLQNYSRKKYVKNSLKGVNLYEKNKFISYVEANFDKFLKTESSPVKVIKNYVETYNEIFEILSNLNRNGVVNYKKFEKDMYNFEFYKISRTLSSITINEVNGKVMSKKYYLLGLIEELNFNDSQAVKYYELAIQYNEFDPKIYNRLGAIFFKNYEFDRALNILETGLANASFNSKQNKNTILILREKIASVYYTRGYLDRAALKYTDVLSQAVADNNVKYQWLSFYNIGLINHRIGNFYIANVYFRNSLKLAVKMKDNEKIAMTLNMLSLNNYNYGDYQAGKKNALKAIKVSKKVNLELISESSLNACLNYEYLNDSQLARTYCERSIKINSLLANKINHPSYFLKNGYMFTYIGTVANYERGLFNYENAYNLSESLGLQMAKTRALSGIAFHEKIGQKYDSALKRLNEILNINNKLGIVELSCVDCNLGFTYWGMKKYDEAIKYYKKSIGLSKINDNRMAVSSSASHLASVYDILGRYKEALEYSNMALEANKKMYRYDHHYIRYEEAQNRSIMDKINNKNNNKNNL